MGLNQIQDFRRTKILVTLAVIVLMNGWLLWQFFHGGVPSHHILHQKDLPEISDWWGGLLLPILTWILLSKTQSRLLKQPESQKSKIIVLFLAGLVLAIAIVISFTNDYKFFLDNVPYIFLLLSLIIPIYYSEFILGFILGMTYTFGVILPTAFVLILSGIGFLIYRFL